MYERQANDGHTVRWTGYENDDLAAHAMEITPDTGVPEHANVPDEANVPVEADVAAGVRQAYRWLELVAEYDGEGEALDYDDREELRERYEELREENEDDEADE